MIKDRRVEPVRQPADVLRQSRGTVFQNRQLLSDLSIRGGELMTQQIQFERQESHLLIHGVVKLAGDPAALPFQERDQLSGECPQILSMSLRA